MPKRREERGAGCWRELLTFEQKKLSEAPLIAQVLCMLVPLDRRQHSGLLCLIQGYRVHKTPPSPF